MTAFADLVDEIAASLKPSVPQAGYPAAVRDFAAAMKAAEVDGRLRRARQAELHALSRA